MDAFRRSGLAFVCAVALQLALPAGARAQAVLRVNDDVAIRFGFLLQPQADWLEAPVTHEYSKNLFLRRARLLLGGTVAKKISFFFETDDPNLGKVNEGTKVIATGFTVQHAFMSWTMRPEAILSGGLILTGIAHNSLQSAGALLPIDFGPYSYLYSGPQQNIAGRDAGFQLHGHINDGRLEYRTGVWQGRRDSLSRDEFRWTARVQAQLLDRDKAFFYPGTTLGTKKLLSVGAGVDWQNDYHSIAADAFLDHPLGAGAVTAQLNWIHYDGGNFLPQLASTNTLYAEGGYYFPRLRLQPYAAYAWKDREDDVASGDEHRWAVGVAYLPRGLNFNIKAQFTRIAQRGTLEGNEFQVQMQAFYW